MYVVLGKPGELFYWHQCGPALPRLQINHPALQEVHGRRRLLPREIEQNRARKALKELSDWEEGRDKELREARERRRSSAWRRPGRLCPAWLLNLFASPVS